MLKSISEPVSASSVPKFLSGEPWYHFEELLRAELAKKHVWYLFADVVDQPYLDPTIAIILVQIQQNALYQPPDTIDFEGFVVTHDPIPYALSHDQHRSHAEYKKQKRFFDQHVTTAFYTMKDSLSDFVWQTLLTSNYEDTQPIYSADKLKNIFAALKRAHGTATPARVEANYQKIQALPGFETHLVAESTIVAFNRLYQERLAWGVEYVLTPSMRLLWINNRLNTPAFLTVLEAISASDPPPTPELAMQRVLTHIKALKDRLMSVPLSVPQTMFSPLVNQAITTVRRCHVCGSPDHILKDCPLHQRSLVVHQQSQRRRVDSPAGPKVPVRYPSQVPSSVSSSRPFHTDSRPPNNPGRGRGRDSGRGRGGRYPPTSAQLQQRSQVRNQRFQQLQASLSELIAEEDQDFSEFDDSVQDPYVTFEDPDSEVIETDFFQAYQAQGLPSEDVDPSWGV